MLVTSVHIKGSTLLQLTGVQYQISTDLLDFSPQSASRDDFQRCMQQTLDAAGDSRSPKLTLPPASVTALELDREWKPTVSDRERQVSAVQQLGSVLSQLTNLQQLSFHGYEREPLPSISIAPLASLQQLTNLDIGHIGNACDLRCLPTQLKHLSLSFRPPKIHPQPLYQIVGHLTCLQQLVLEMWDNRKEDVQRLAEVASRLMQLQRIRLTLPSYPCLSDAKCLWPQLSSLRCLEIVDPHDLYPGTYTDLLGSLVTATGLTKLHIGVGDDIHAYGMGEAELKAVASNNTNLQELIWYPCPELSTEVDHPLANLTQLTKLAVWSHSIENAMLKMLAQKLTNLRCLDVGHSGPDHISVYPMPAIGRLSSLTRLRLANLSADVARQGLQYLTGLKQLAELSGFGGAGCKPLERFWARIGVDATEVQYDKDA